MAATEAANPVVHGPAQCLSHRIEVGRVLKHRFSKSSAIKIQSGVAQCQSMRYRKTGDSERFRLMSIRFSRFDVAARNGSKEICRVVVKDNFSAGSARGFNSPASQLTASVFSGSNDIETCSVRPQVEHSNVRTSKPLGRDRCSPKPTGACTPHTSAARSNHDTLPAALYPIDAGSLQARRLRTEISKTGPIVGTARQEVASMGLPKPPAYPARVSKNQGGTARTTLCRICQQLRGRSARKEPHHGSRSRNHVALKRQYSSFVCFICLTDTDRH